MSSVRRSPLPVLTSLRFFAAIAVVAFHIVVSPWGQTLPLSGFLKNLAGGGYSGVTFFFILSGFILTYAHAGRTEGEGLDVRPWNFWRLRAARIVPVYYFSLLIAFPYLDQFLQSAGGSDRIVGPTLVVLFLQAWWPPLAETWNYPAWSLSVEAVFYALFPWLFGGTAPLKRHWLFIIAYALTIASTACRAVLSGNSLGAHFPLFHLPIFIFGMALGRQVLFGSRLSPGSHGVMFAVGTVATVLLFGFTPVAALVDEK